jgi:hypothetical protein
MWQGSTKIYKTLGLVPRVHQPNGVAEQIPAWSTDTTTTGTTVQSFMARVGAGATLALLPDPYTCFRWVFRETHRGPPTQPRIDI